jgi:ATP-dependent HslUV protease ATP-binding subunit HslU
MRNLTPKNIVKELDKYIIGQNKAKRAVAIALRNRWRRQRIKGKLKDEIIPNNIILIGPTGVGKTEIARRLSEITDSPFIKVEASKFTEVGYVGRDVESMIRELMNVAINLTKKEQKMKVKKQARENAINKILEMILPKPPKISFLEKENKEDRMAHYNRTKEKLREKLLKGKLDNREVELNIPQKKVPQIEILSNINMDNIDLQINEMLSNIMSNKYESEKAKYKIPKALEILTEEEIEKMINKEQIIEIAKSRVENDGIIFIDEIDKIANDRANYGNDVSRSGVQRDLLPIVEGSNVPTKFGMINTSHILFIAAGAFSVSKPSDLIPELQGRFPIREELNSLTEEDFEKILILPENALTKQYKALFKAEKVSLEFTSDSIKAIARYAAMANEKMEDIGARRLHTIMNTLLEDYLFDIPSVKMKKLIITKEEVDKKLEKIIFDEDLSRYIL